MRFDFDADGLSQEALDDKLQLTIYRIIQEQVNNILRHANATHASIYLSRQGNKIMLVISDNGKGCDIENEKNGVGIINIRSRAELYDGTVAIASRPGQGFELKVVLALSTPTG